MAIPQEMKNEGKTNLRLAELETLNENRLVAQQNIKLYWQKIEAFNKRVSLLLFQKSDLVLAISHDHRQQERETWTKLGWSSCSCKSLLKRAYLIKTMDALQEVMVLEAHIHLPQKAFLLRETSASNI